MIALAILDEDYNSNYAKIQIIKEFVIEIKGATYCDPKLCIPLCQESWDRFLDS